VLSFSSFSSSSSEYAAFCEAPAFAGCGSAGFLVFTTRALASSAFLLFTAPPLLLICFLSVCGCAWGLCLLTCLAS